MPKLTITLVTISIALVFLGLSIPYLLQIFGILNSTMFAGVNEINNNTLLNPNATTEIVQIGNTTQTVVAPDHGTQGFNFMLVLISFFSFILGNPVPLIMLIGISVIFVILLEKKSTSP